MLIDYEIDSQMYLIRQKITLQTLYLYHQKISISLTWPLSSTRHKTISKCALINGKKIIKKRWYLVKQRLLKYILEIFGKVLLVCSFLCSFLSHSQRSGYFSLFKGMLRLNIEHFLKKRQYENEEFLKWINWEKVIFSLSNGLYFWFL